MAIPFASIVSFAATTTLAAAGSTFAQAAAAPQATGSQAMTSAQQSMAVTGLTVPSDVRKIGFSIRGVVAKVDVKKNDVIRAKQPLLSLDDTEERATLEMYKLAADTALQVAEAGQKYELKKLDYERKKSLFENAESRGSASDFEVRTAETEMNIAKIGIDAAKHEGAQNQARADSQAARVGQMHKLVPEDFGDGQVSEVMVKEGEQVDESKPVMEIVDLDPLYVDVTLVDTSVVQRLKLGQKVQVRYADEQRVREATVDAIDPSADKRSGKHPFRLSLPNPEGRNAGLRVEIQLPATAVASGN